MTESRKPVSGKHARSAVDAAIAELDRLAAARPALNPHCRWLRAMLPDLASPIPIPAALQSLSAEHARARLEGGLPLLRGEALALDGKSFRQRWQRACAALEEKDGAAAALAQAVSDNRLVPEEMLHAVLAGEPEGVRTLAEERGFDPVLAGTILRFTLFPMFAAIETSLAPLRAGVIWERGYCPTCGSWPLLGEFRGLDQSRFLRCGLCAAAWEVPRQWCGFCGNRDHEQLGFLHCEGEEAKYRAATCDACRGYVKMVSTLFGQPPLQMLVADITTLHLDLAAAERGYSNHS